MTMNTTSSPSSSTALKAARPAIQSSEACLRRASAGEVLGLGRERRLLVVQGDDARRAQDRLAQPPHAEQQEKHADHELEQVQRHAVEQGPERHDQQPEHAERRERSRHRGTPAPQGGDGEHDGEGLDDLDERGDERCADGRCGYAPGNRLHRDRSAACSCCYVHLRIHVVHATDGSQQDSAP